MIHGKNIYLRQVEEDDINLLLLWENDTENWRYSETEAPFSRFEIAKYVETASQVRQNLQMRLMICVNETGETIGNIDLFNINFKHSRAGVGILIAKHEFREKGLAFEALILLQEFAFLRLELNQLYCDIISDNSTSIRLFEKAGFIKTGEKKKWYQFNGKAFDAYFYQKLFVK